MKTERWRSLLTLIAIIALLGTGCSSAPDDGDLYPIFKQIIAQVNQGATAEFVKLEDVTVVEYIEEAKNRYDVSVDVHVKFLMNSEEFVQRTRSSAYADSRTGNFGALGAQMEANRMIIAAGKFFGGGFKIGETRTLNKRVTLVKTSKGWKLNQ